MQKLSGMCHINYRPATSVNIPSFFASYSDKSKIDAMIDESEIGYMPNGSESFS
jgi:hypothetical protein